jgi:glycosyltransferase involved in cell wall biosynthesis
MSATIGRGRGLEDAVRALALLPGHVRLTLYGRVLPLFDRELHTLVAELGLGARIAIRPIPEPLAIMPAIARADIGLALDPNDCLNRSLTICNKVFLYLQAGTALAATDTPGQREVVADAPGCGFVYQPGDVSALAAHLMPLVSDRARLLEAQTAAWNAGRQRFNWDVEQRTFLTAVRQAVRPRDRAALELTA